MPIVTVAGLPPNVQLPVLFALEEAVKTAVASIPALQLVPDQVTVHFPSDLMQVRRTDIIVTITGLFDKPERTNEVRQQTVDAVGSVLKIFAEREFRHCKLIEVLPTPPFDPRQGFTRIEL